MPLQAEKTEPGAGSAWTPQDLAGNPHANPRKEEKVRRMFASIAPRYDLNNRLHSLGRDQAWRRAAVRMAGLRPGEHVLDVACGTGDLTRAFADAGAGRVVGVDFTPEMLEIAMRKRLGPRDGGADAPETIEYVRGDAEALALPDASFDIVSIAFGIRNVSSPEAALREFRRVLRPGGRLVVLEFGRPTARFLAWLHDLYCRRVMPLTATLISGDRTGAYRYLPRSVETFLSRETMEGAIRAAGFEGVHHRAMTFGVCVCYRGDVPRA